MRRLIAVGCVGITVLLAGCATGSQSYTPPEKAYTLDSSKVVDKGYDALWAEAVPSLGKQFFVINNLDKASGLINVSYSGDPEKYVDCGSATSQVTNLRGKRFYFYPASKAFTEFETFSPQTGLLSFRRNMSLEGRINLIFEKLGAQQTKVTANTKYILTRKFSGRAATGQYLGTSSDSISFTNSQKGAFEPNSNGAATTCVSTGALEKAILDAIH